MTVRGVSGTSSVHQKVKCAPGVSTGSRGTSGVSKGVSKDVRGVRGSIGTPVESRGGQGGNQVIKEVKNSVRGFPGVEGSLGDPQGLTGASGVY